MNVSVGDLEYEQLGDWAELPANGTVERGWSHHGMAFSSEIHSALTDEDIVGLEQIIKKVGAEAVFGVFLTEDFSGRRLIHYMENYPMGLRESRTCIQPEFLALALKYDPELKLGARLRYL